jgi:hypothetical protein
MKYLALSVFLLCTLQALAQAANQELVLFIERGEADRRNLQKTCVSVHKDGSYQIEKVYVDITHPDEYSAKIAFGQLTAEKIRELTESLNSKELAESKQRATLYIGPGFTDGEYAVAMIVRGRVVQVLSHANTFGILGSVDGTVRIVEKPHKEYKALLDWVRSSIEKQKSKFQKLKQSDCAQPKATSASQTPAVAAPATK